MTAVFAAPQPTSGLPPPAELQQRRFGAEFESCSGSKTQGDTSGEGWGSLCVPGRLQSGDDSKGRAGALVLVFILSIQHKVKMHFSFFRAQNTLKASREAKDIAGVTWQRVRREHLPGGMETNVLQTSKAGNSAVRGSAEFGSGWAL